MHSMNSTGGGGLRKSTQSEKFAALLHIPRNQPRNWSKLVLDVEVIQISTE